MEDEDDEILDYLETTEQALILSPTLVVSGLDSSNLFIKRIQRTFSLDSVQSSTANHFYLVATSSKPGSHKLDSLSLLTAAIAIAKNFPRSCLALIMQNKLEMSITERIQDLSVILGGSMKPGITLTKEARVFLSSSGIPVSNTDTSLLSEMEFKDCIDFFQVKSSFKKAA